MAVKRGLLEPHAPWIRIDIHVHVVALRDLLLPISELNKACQFGCND